MPSSRKKHKLLVEVNDGSMKKMRVIVDRGSLVRDLQAAVQERLLKKRRTEADAYPIVTEIYERINPTRNGGGDGGDGGGGDGSSALTSAMSPDVVELDGDDALSDIMDSDAEDGMTFVAMLKGEESSVASAGSPAAIASPGVAATGSGGSAGGAAFALPGAAAAAAAGPEGAAAGIDRKNAAACSAPAVAPAPVPLVSNSEPLPPPPNIGKRGSEVLHRISYTVAGMPRPDGSGCDRRGAREGVVTASTGWALRDLKRAIGQAEGVVLTPDANPACAAAVADSLINVRVALAPNVSVPMKVSPIQTVRDLWGMVSRASSAARTAAAAAATAQPGHPRSSTGAEDTEAVVAAAAAAAAEVEESGPAGEYGGGGGEVGGSGEKNTSRLPDGQVLMRQAGARARDPSDSSSAQSLMLSGECAAAGAFLCFPEDVLGDKGCCLEDGEELILVGPGAISADDIPAWAVHVRVLGQPVGYITIPNRRLGEAAIAPSPMAESSSGVSGKDAGNSEGSGATAGTQQQQMRTLGELRALLSKELMVPSDKVEVWIALPFEDSGGSGSARSTVPEEPRGEKASFDNMSLGHLGSVI